VLLFRHRIVDGVLQYAAHDTCLVQAGQDRLYAERIRGVVARRHTQGCLIVSDIELEHPFTLNTCLYQVIGTNAADL